MPSVDKNERQNNFFDTCSQCKTRYSCCHDTTPPVTHERRKIIEAYLKKQNIKIEKPFANTEYVFPRLDADQYCVFHDRKTRKCIVHSVKPETCVAGPITFDINIRTGKIEWFLKMDKICQLAGVVDKNKVQLHRHLESARKEITRLVEQLDAEALKVILKKDEPETFKFDEDTVDKHVLDKLR
jgi:Fe-S-cluster containining protein